jgi:hypothetical protein
VNSFLLADHSKTKESVVNLGASRPSEGVKQFADRSLIGRGTDGAARVSTGWFSKQKYRRELTSVHLRLSAFIGSRYLFSGLNASKPCALLEFPITPLNLLPRQRTEPIHPELLAAEATHD